VLFPRLNVQADDVVGHFFAAGALAAILRCRAFPIASMRRNQRNAFGSKDVIERITVIGTIPNNRSSRPKVKVSLSLAPNNLRIY
jgi:hypothetical protein